MRQGLVLVLSGIFVGMAQAAVAQCPTPQFVYMTNLQIHTIGESFPVSVKHAANSKVEFKFEYRNINTKLFGPPNPYQPDTYTKVANVVQSAAVNADSTTSGTITEIQPGFWKMYVRARCTLGKPNPAAPPPMGVSAWSAPLEYIALEKGSDGIFATVRVNPLTPPGECPATLCADAAVQSYYQMPVNFSWMLSDGKTGLGGSLTFSSALEVKEAGPMCFPIGNKSTSDWTDPPHSGAMYLVVNGKKAFPMPGASYQVNCPPQPMRKSVKSPQPNTLQQKNIRMMNKVR